MMNSMPIEAPNCCKASKRGRFCLALCESTYRPKSKAYHISHIILITYQISKINQ